MQKQVRSIALPHNTFGHFPVLWIGLPSYSSGKEKQWILSAEYSWGLTFVANAHKTRLPPLSFT
ncbi:MAG: hypothetical protein AAFX53_08560 [Bacteroidota bacterium]